MSSKSEPLGTRSPEALMHQQMEEVANRSVAQFVLQAFQQAEPAHDGDTVALLAPFDEPIHPQRADLVSVLITNAMHDLIPASTSGKVAVTHGDDGQPNGITVYFSGPDAQEQMDLFRRLIPHMDDYLSGEKEADLSEGTIIHDPNIPSDAELQEVKARASTLLDLIVGKWGNARLRRESNFTPYLEACIDTADETIKADKIVDLLNGAISKMGPDFEDILFTCGTDDEKSMSFYASFSCDDSQVNGLSRKFQNSMIELKTTAMGILEHHERLLKLPNKVIDAATAEEDKKHDMALSVAGLLMDEIFYNGEFSEHQYFADDGTSGTIIELDLSESPLIGYSDEEWQTIISMFNDIVTATTVKGQSTLHIADALHIEDEKTKKLSDDDMLPLHLIFPNAPDEDAFSEAIKRDYDDFKETTNLLRLGTHAVSTLTH